METAVGKKSMMCTGGPLKGEILALDVSKGEEMSFRLGDGRTAIYKVKRVWHENEYLYDGGKYEWELKFIGIDPFA